MSPRLILLAGFGRLLALPEARLPERSAAGVDSDDRNGPLLDLRSIRSSNGARPNAGSADAFLRDEVYPRRSTMLSIADQIDHLNERQLNDGGRQVSNLCFDFRRSLAVALAVTLCLGLIVAAYSIHGVLQLPALRVTFY